jgi:hypothetical protein
MSETTAVAPIDQVEALAAEAAQKSETIMVREESFELAPQIPAIVMLRLTAAGDSKTAPARQMGAILDFLNHAVAVDDRERFMDFLEEADPIIDFDELNKILESATEVIAARPTEQS